MANFVLSEPTSQRSPRATSSPQSSPKMSSKGPFAAKITGSRPIKSPKPGHLSELAMPSPVSTPGAEHLSDMSSCCSVDDTDSIRSSPQGSPTSPLTINSFSTPASDVKRKYKLWSTIRSDYYYLMDEEIIDTCRSTESDLSFESDDQTAAVAVVSFKGFMQQYSELSSWLGTVLQKAKRQSSCLSEKYVNQAFHEDMLKHMVSLKFFKDYAKQLTRSHPRLKDDISLHLKQVNGMWEDLERLLLPNGNHSDQRKMLHDMELDFDGLRQWVDDMEVKRRTWRLHSHWVTSDIDRQLDIQRVLQAQIELHSRVVRALMSLCNRLTTDSDDSTGGGMKVSQEAHSRAVHLKEQVTDIQEELNVIWLNSLEWQMTLEEAKKNGIHVRRDAEDDQWDRMRATAQRKQTSNLQALSELSSDFVDEDDSFFHNRSLHRKKRINSEDESEVKSDDADVPVNERSTGPDGDDYGVPDASYLRVPVDHSCRSYSDPLLTRVESCDRMPHGGVNSSSGAKAKQDAGNAEEVSTGNRENDFSREWSPGQLRRYGAIDLMAAFGEDRKEVTADVGYSSGSHSNEETDSSARQALFVWPQNKRQPSGSQIYANEAIRKENILNSPMVQFRNAAAGKVEAEESLNSSDRAFDYDSRSLEAADEVSLPETEDEMSVELPLDDVPVVQSDRRVAELFGPLLKRALSSKPTVRRNLRFLDDSSTSDFDSWSKAKASGLRSSPKKKHGTGKLENDPKMSLAEKMNGGERQKTKVLCGSTPLSGSCYASSEGTESESDFTGHNLPIEGHERKFGCRLRSRWKGSSSLRSSPVKEVVEMSSGRSPLKRRMSEDIESILSDRHELKLTHRLWMSDGAISELLREDTLSPNKIPKMSFSKTSDCLESGSLTAFHCSSKGLDDFARNDGHDAVKQKPGSSAQGNVSSQPVGRVLQRFSNDLPDFLGRGEDALVPNCDSLNSSLTELTSDDCQMYNSDYEKMGEEEMQWHDDGYLGSNFEGEAKKSIKDHSVGLQSGRLAMDSDSDVEDFRHVLNESGKGLKFIETMIRQDYRFSESASSTQDPSTFNEPLATCRTNIVCLKELIDALRLKNKLDGEILQVTEIVSRWQQLQGTLLLLQKESQRIFEFQAEVNGIRMELQNLNAVVEFDDKFCNIRQLEEAVKAVKSVQFELNEKTDLRLQTLDAAYGQFVSERSDLDPQLFAVGEQVEQLKKYRNSFSKRCESDERKLKSALISWHKFNGMEKELNCLLQCSDPAAADAEQPDDLGVMKKNWKLLDEKLQQLSLVYLDFATVCSDSSALALKQAITLSSSQLQILRQTNDEKLIKLVNAKRGSSFPEEVGHQVAAASSQAFAKDGNVSPVKSTVRPSNYILPVTLTFVLIGCLYALFGDSWYELFGSLGLILDPDLKHVKGPPPS